VQQAEWAHLVICKKPVLFFRMVNEQLAAPQRV
jgi:hypothetical protein